MELGVGNPVGLLPCFCSEGGAHSPCLAQHEAAAEETVFLALGPKYSPKQEEQTDHSPHLDFGKLDSLPPALLSDPSGKPSQIMCNCLVNIPLTKIRLILPEQQGW